MAPDEMPKPPVRIFDQGPAIPLDSPTQGNWQENRSPSGRG